MILTSNYKLVLASFDRPQPFQKTIENFGGSRNLVGYQFEVGPLVYEVYCFGNNDYWSIGFRIADVKGTNEELAEYFSTVYRRKVNSYDVPHYRRNILNNPTDDLGIVNATTVFATVIDIVKDLDNAHPVRCLSFSATSGKKSRLYSRLVRAYMPDWDVNDEGLSFEVCRKRA
jgi:hypothetical protein